MPIWSSGDKKYAFGFSHFMALKPSSFPWRVAMREQLEAGYIAADSVSSQSCVLKHNDPFLSSYDSWREGGFVSFS